MGMGGFLPTTAKSVCQRGLSKSGDGDVNSCDFWSTKVTFHAIAYWLHAIGYRAELSRNEKINVMTKNCAWNCSRSYVSTLVDRAAEINSIVGDVSVVGIGGSESNPDNVLDLVFTPIAMIKFIARWFLELANLLPETPGWLLSPLRPEDMTIRYANGISNHFNPPEHFGMDFPCRVGADVLAVANGLVVEPDPGTYMSQEGAYGNRVWIDHGGLFGLYAHMSKVNVQAGQEVKQGDVIGLCGNSGKSNGSHVHFAVATKHPNEFVNWRDMNPGFDDPALYLGKCGVTTVAGDGTSASSFRPLVETISSPLYFSCCGSYQVD